MHPRNPGLSITCITPGKIDQEFVVSWEIFIRSGRTLIANRKIANIMIPPCRGDNFISSVTKNNLGKTQGCHQIWRDRLVRDMPFLSYRDETIDLCVRAQIYQHIIPSYSV